MCGIAGIFHPVGVVDLSRLEAMGEVLDHRGPDDHHSLRAPGGGFTARRLSIQDPAGGRQPLRDASGRWHVALNGEIYNYPALRRECEAWGTRFRSTGDTEVVAEVVARLGMPAALEHLDGMFALAVHDTLERRLWIARDRMGEKPLYHYTLDDGTLIFGSELKALLVHGGLKRRVDPIAIGQYLLFEYVPSPRCIYEGARKLEPGSWLRYDAEGLRAGRYWRWPAPAGGNGTPGDLREWARVLRGAFQVSVLSRQLSDVPVGYVLSGGLDSASVMAVAARKGGDPPATFTLTLPIASFDESAPARITADHFSCNHKEIPFTFSDLPETIQGIAERLDEPLGDSSLPATWWLFRHVHEAGYKVALSGDGADEILAGYPTYLAHRLAPLASLMAPLLRRIVGHLPVSYENVSRDYKARRFVAGLSFPLPRRNQIWLGAFLPDDLDGDPGEALWAEVDALARSYPGIHPLGQAMLLDQRFYLGDGVLSKVDRASMAASVEVRAPFLDHRLVELAAQIPSGLKLRGTTTKAVWREAMKDWLPPEIISRPKKGFGTPVGPWLRGPCSHLLKGLEDPVEAWVRPERVRGWVREHLEGRADHRRRLWSLLVLGRWRQGPWGPG